MVDEDPLETRLKALEERFTALEALVTALDSRTAPSTQLLGGSQSGGDPQ